MPSLLRPPAVDGAEPPCCACYSFCACQVASDYMDKKSLERFGEEGQAPDNAAPTVPRCAALRCAGSAAPLRRPALQSVLLCATCAVQCAAQTSQTHIN